MIPLYLLPHTVTRERVIQVDAWGATDVQTVTVPNVRIEPQTGRKWGMTADLPEIKARLFANDPDIIREGDRITFEGVTYTVKTVAKLYGFDFDHLECDLI